MNMGELGISGFIADKNYAVFGKHDSITEGFIAGNYWGVQGKYNLSPQVDQKTNTGMLGGEEYGVYGETGKKESFAVYGKHIIDNIGYLGGDSCGVYGKQFYGNWGYLGGRYGVFGSFRKIQGRDSNWGFIGSENEGVYGSNGIIGTQGALANGLAGVYGLYSKNGNYGYLGSSEAGVEGVGENIGVTGHSKLGTGLHGINEDSKNYGYVGHFSYGVFGYAQNTFQFAVRGENEGAKAFGYLGGMNMGVYGKQTSDNNKWGYLGGKTYSGAFGEDVLISRNCQVGGNLTKAGGNFQIDHPLDPANKFLNHSFVESPERINLYTGQVILGTNGDATVVMPDWFETLNREFTYQLTAVGGPGPGLYIAKEMKNNQFIIAGGTPGLKVSWMVTGIRHDPWAEANPMVVEEEKPSEKKGFYIHPDLFGQPADKQLNYQNAAELVNAETFPMNQVKNE
jgi:hypothetical protein